MIESRLPIYMDYHATTPVDQRVVAKMMPFFTEHFGNASSIDHIYGAQAAEAIEHARVQVANGIRAQADEIFFTSGATESDNLALVGVMERQKLKGDHLISCVTEHKAVLETAQKLEKIGKKVTFLPVDRFGKVTPASIEDAITKETVLISVMTANNEIGTIAPIKEIGAIARDNDILFHTDAAQAVGHIPLDVDKMNIDLLSLSGHKTYGPKGIGALFIAGVNPKAILSPAMSGGGHERGMRPGTLNVPGIVGLGEAVAIAGHEMNNENRRYRKWTDRMFESFNETLKRVSLNGHPLDRLAHNLNVCFPGIESKALIYLLRNDLAISSGSACTTTTVESSHVLRAIGVNENDIHTAIRFGLGRFNSEEEVEYAIEKIIWAVHKLAQIK